MSYEIPEAELEFKATRAGGPGGQHVNTTASRVEVVWDLSASPTVSDAIRARLEERLAHRIDKRGRLRVTCADGRSQARNREIAIARLQALIAGALARQKPRRKTRTPARAKRKRLEAKRQTKEKKANRRPPQHP